MKSINSQFNIKNNKKHIKRNISDKNNTNNLGCKKIKHNNLIWIEDYWLNKK